MTDLHTASAESEEAKTLLPDTCRSLVLLLDGSGSVDDTGNWENQYRATARALMNEKVQEAIFADGGTLAVKAIKFDHEQRHLATWHSVESPEDMQVFVDNMTQRAEWQNFFGSTEIGEAAHYALDQFETSPCQSDKRVIDISTDGKNTGEVPLASARERAMDNGVIINGIAVNGEQYTMQIAAQQLREHLVTGFVVEADWEHYERVLEHKMYLELSDSAPVSPEATPVRQAVAAAASTPEKM